MKTAQEMFAGFTHLDPFVDTESASRRERHRRFQLVSPTSIRLWILKAQSSGGAAK